MEIKTKRHHVKPRCIFLIGVGGGVDVTDNGVIEHVKKFRDNLELSDDYENVFIPTSDEYGTVKVQMFNKDYQ